MRLATSKWFVLLISIYIQYSRSFFFYQPTSVPLPLAHDLLSARFALGRLINSTVNTCQSYTRLMYINNVCGCCDHDSLCLANKTIELSSRLTSICKFGGGTIYDRRIRLELGYLTEIQLCSYNIRRNADHWFYLFRTTVCPELYVYSGHLTPFGTIF